ncbi:hypothetical protein PMG11_06047 [Penicillium brasilianum]|uniref:Uncharacterized protein n=1 Tax=Penicillium brasilianum TaxID=104259 RepID=A0A0F7TNB2_PENBI|nr:hypothetical protein PMG11_06047 [Penicillium brasilianum]
MTRGKCDPTSIEPDLAPFKVAAAGFANMFCIGTVYALSTFQAQLPRLFGISYAWSFAPFGVACLGLSIGVLTSASMIIQSGAHVTVARGTSLWGIAVIGAGLFLNRLKFELMVTCFLFGGLGIGWTYLAVVALIGQGLPRHALARSAIGPLGFSTAATICFLLSSVSGVEAADAETLGRMLVFLGVTFAAVGASTQLSLSDFYENSAVRSQPKSSSRDCGPFFSILLFFNALPGMTVFSGLLPLASHYTNGTNYDIMWILSYLLLILLSHFEHSTQVMCTMLVVLFAHGTGFSILPGLIKTQSSNQQLFYFKYARVLISWGVSGIVGSTVNSIVLSSGSPVPTGWLLVGLLTLSFGIVLYFVPTLGGEFFD